MQKIYIISCCGECPAYRLQKGQVPFCERQGWEIDGDSSSPVNPILTEFPDWCPLETADESGEKCINYTRVIERIMRIVEEDAPDALQEASLYLNSVFERNRNKSQTGEV